MKPNVTPTPKDPYRYLPKPGWYLGDAQMIIRELQKILWPIGWHVCLGGGVLNHGYSANDLDLYVLPIYRDGVKTELDALTAVNGYFTSDGTYDENGDVKSTCDVEHECFAYCQRYTNPGKSVEVFVVRR